MKKLVIYLLLVVTLAVITTLALNTPVHGATQAKFNREVACMAHNIYFEAHNQDHKGRIAVGNVTQNRVKSSRFANSVCGVVYDKSKRLNGKPYCEFSWATIAKGRYCTSGGKKYNRKLYNDIKETATMLLTINHVDYTEGALFYHADYVNGGWFKKNVTKTVQIGTHIFYK